MFWADIVSKESKAKEPILVNDSKTPSGKIHVGSLRGVLVHDLVFKAFLRAGKASSYSYDFDDFDPMDSLPGYLPKEKYEKYMGFPLKDVPSPVEGYASYAEYYAQDFIKVFNSLGVAPEIIWSFEDIYSKGKFDSAIEIVLNNASKIQKIYQKVSGSQKKKDWYPFQPVCENCGKIGTTRVFAWDGQLVSYKCEPEMVVWATGCGHEAKVSPFGGKGKMPWKVEWASKWFIWNVGFEGSGKDHTSKGGSRDVANHIAKEVFKIEPPEDLPYEFFIYGGRKMSSSKGIGASASVVAEILPPSVLRFLNARYHPRVAIDFDPTHPGTIPNLFDEYDRAREAFFLDPKSDLGRTFEAGNIGKPKQVFVPRFSLLASWTRQPGIDIEKEAEKTKGEKLASEDIKELKERTAYVQIWLERFASEENKKIEVGEQTKLNLTSAQKQLLEKLTKELEKDWEEDALQTKVYELTKEAGLKPKEGFQLLYSILIGRESGPRIGSLLLSDKKKALVAIQNQL